MATPIYEMVLGNLDHGAHMNRTSVSNLAIDHDGSGPECMLSPTIDGISVPAHSEAMVVETSQEITKSVNINPCFQTNACPIISIDILLIMITVTPCTLISLLVLV